MFILEKLSGMELMDSVDDSEAWQPPYIEAAIDGIAELHAISYGQDHPLASHGMMKAKELWIALAEHARPIFSGWIGPEFGFIQHVLIERLQDVWRSGEEMPRTLIHNDFNPRNVAFRRIGGERRLCVYDWEMATVGLPQHDLAELLCFVLRPGVGKPDVLRYIERHRLALKYASCRPIDPEEWLLGFRLSLYDLMVNRLPAYAMIHRFQQQRFIERVIRTWKAIFDLLGEE